MGTFTRNHSPGRARARARARTRTLLFPLAALLALCSFTAFILLQVNYFVSHTKTVAGHNLDPTPWHLFPPKNFEESSKYIRASTIIQCSYLTCRRSPINFGAFEPDLSANGSGSSASKCPSFFRWIHQDLQPWAKTRISKSKLLEAQKKAALRIVIVGGKLYVDFYFACVQSRAMFTIWGLLQLLRRYPGMVPDVDLMFDCMDRPVISHVEYGSDAEGPPPPLFRYCTTEGHFDIPFPDWSFWGWPEVNIQPWDQEFGSIKQGSQEMSWDKKWPRAFWKGNPDVDSPVRIELLSCNHLRKWGAQIISQNWTEEAQAGFEQSKLANQCKHRYKIYAEGFAWSVSLKYIISCGSLTLIISPQYEDFFSRGLFPKENYWPISRTPDLCRSIKYAVDWGNDNPAMAETIGKRGQKFMEDLSMDTVYDYIYHLVVEYSKLLDFKPFVPSTAQEVCTDSVLCYADPTQRPYLETSAASPSSRPPCTLPPHDPKVIETVLKRKRKIISDVQDLERM